MAQPTSGYVPPDYVFQAYSVPGWDDADTVGPRHAATRVVDGGYALMDAKSLELANSTLSRDGTWIPEGNQLRLIGTAKLDENVDRMYRYRATDGHQGGSLFLGRKTTKDKLVKLMHHYGTPFAPLQIHVLPGEGELIDINKCPLDENNEAIPMMRYRLQVYQFIAHIQ